MVARPVLIVKVILPKPPPIWKRGVEDGVFVVDIDPATMVRPVPVKATVDVIVTEMVPGRMEACDPMMTAEAPTAGVTVPAELAAAAPLIATRSAAIAAPAAAAPETPLTEIVIAGELAPAVLEAATPVGARIGVGPRDPMAVLPLIPVAPNESAMDTDPGELAAAAPLNAAEAPAVGLTVPAVVLAAAPVSATCSAAAMLPTKVAPETPVALMAKDGEPDPGAALAETPVVGICGAASAEPVDVAELEPVAAIVS